MNTADIDFQPTVHQLFSLRDTIKQALNDYFQVLTKEDQGRVYANVLSEFEQPLLEKLMEYTRQNQSMAARILGVGRGTLRSMLKTYDLL